MTSQEKEELRVKVARAAGLDLQNNPTYGGDGELHDSWSLGIEGDKAIPIPDYPSSLDACAEFEKTLTADDRVNYVNQLYFVTFTPGQDRDFGVVFSTAEQRCLAFLKAKGKA